MKYLQLLTTKFIARLLMLSLVSSVLLLTACGDSSDLNDNPQQSTIDLPDGKKLIFVDARSPEQYLYDTDTESKTNLNTDPNQNYYLANSAEIGHFLSWADDTDSDGQVNDEKIIMMNNSYTKGDVISSTDFLYLAHYHGADFAAHANEEFVTPSVGSRKYYALRRLNNYVVAQNDLFTEIDEALTADTTAGGQGLCQAFVDPYASANHGHSAGSTEVAATHYALTKSGRIYFYEETNGSLASSQDSFIELDGVANIEDCNKATITRTGEHGVLVFIAASQKLYLVDSHGADFHVHSTWDIADIMPMGFIADYMGAIGEGENDH